MEIKKSDRANLDQRRVEIFLVAIVLILSSVVVALEWDSTLSDADESEDLDDVIENIDFEKLKKNKDMVAAISETEKPSEKTNVKPTTELVAQKQVEPITSKLVIGDGKTETPQAKVEEVQPRVLEEEDEELPEGYKEIEELPIFPGGATAFMKWITANLKYPPGAQRQSIKGKVIVDFIIDKSGNVTQLKIIKSSNPTLSKAVLDTMGKMPQWQPGRKNGKPCDSMISVPINFEL